MVHERTFLRNHSKQLHTERKSKAVFEAKHPVANPAISNTAFRSRVYKSDVQAGAHNIKYAIKTGTYILRLNADGQSLSKKIFVQ